MSFIDPLVKKIRQDLAQVEHLEHDVYMLSNYIVDLTRNIENVPSSKVEHKIALVTLCNKYYHDTNRKKSEIIQLLKVIERESTSLLKYKAGLYLSYSKSSLLELSANAKPCTLRPEVLAKFPELVRNASTTAR